VTNKPSCRIESKDPFYREKARFEAKKVLLDKIEKRNCLSFVAEDEYLV
jgi:hypothetical protein